MSRTQESGHSVVDGVIRRLSVSQVESFDGDSTFGCERKWWFNKVKHLPIPPMPGQELGTEVHSQIEHYLRTGEDVLGRIARPGKEHIPTDATQPKHNVEREIKFQIAGVPFVGYIDLLYFREAFGPMGQQPDPDSFEIFDWKTSSNVSKYAKTPEQLRKSVQMMSYAHWLFGYTKGDVVDVKLSHVYFQTQGAPRSEKVSVTVDQTEVDDFLTTVEETVTRMKVVAAEVDVRKIPAKADQTFCNRCPFFSQCPKADPFGFTFPTPTIGAPAVSLLDQFLTSPQPPPSQQVVEAQQPVPVVQFTKPEPVAAVLPPDAPKSNPEAPKQETPREQAEKLAQTDVESQMKAVEGPPPVVAEPVKRKPGRPRKNAFPPEAPAPNPETAKLVESIKQQATGITVKSVTYREGLTLKLNPNSYDMARFDVEMTADVPEGISRQQAMAELAEIVGQELAGTLVAHGLKRE